VSSTFHRIPIFRHDPFDKRILEIPARRVLRHMNLWLRYSSARVLVACAHGGLNGSVHIRIFKHYDGSGPPSSITSFFMARPAHEATWLPGAFAAVSVHCGNGRVLDQSGDRRARTRRD